MISRQGDTIILICTAKGGPNNTFRWEKNGSIAGNDSILKLMAINGSYGGDYTCIVSNAAGADSASTTLYVAPYIVTPLEKQILATVDGSIVSVDCLAAGFPTPTVHWVNVMRTEVSSTSQLLLSPVAFGDEGLYQCIASAHINGTDFAAMDEITLISKTSNFFMLLIHVNNLCILLQFLLEAVYHHRTSSLEQVILQHSSAELWVALVIYSNGKEMANLLEMAAC